jgi:glucans biosynthesis protein
MFLFGPSDRADVDDFRPSVHDSDGLQIWTGQGEWIWRPLANPAARRLSAFADDDPRGFGLLQRERDFAAYQDLEARYELRPSLWVEPQGAWGLGHVRLLELPTGEEIHDNIAAFWVSKRPFEPGIERQIAYRLYWGAAPPVNPDRARTLATRVGAGGISGEANEGAWRKFVIDFAGGRLGAIPPDAPVEAEVWHSAGEITAPVAQKNIVTAGWRAFFDLLPGHEEPTELRCVLRLQDTVLTETWTYQWTP